MPVLITRTPLAVQLQTPEEEVNLMFVTSNRCEVWSLRERTATVSERDMWQAGIRMLGMIRPHSLGKPIEREYRYQRIYPDEAIHILTKTEDRCRMVDGLSVSKLQRPEHQKVVKELLKALKTATKQPF